MGLTDTLIVGRHSATELGYQALGWAPTAIVLTTSIGLLTGVQVMTSQAIGEGRARCRSIGRSADPIEVGRLQLRFVGEQRADLVVEPLRIARLGVIRLVGLEQQQFTRPMRGDPLLGEEVRVAGGDELRIPGEVAVGVRRGREARVEELDRGDQAVAVAAGIDGPEAPDPNQRIQAPALAQRPPHPGPATLDYLVLKVHARCVE